VLRRKSLDLGLGGTDGRIGVRSSHRQDSVLRTGAPSSGANVSRCLRIRYEPALGRGSLRLGSFRRMAMSHLHRHAAAQRTVRTGPQALVMAADSLRIPTAMLERAEAIIEVTDATCHEHLDDEYGQIARRLVARLARKRPSPLSRGDVRIWAAGVIYAVGQINFLFDRSQSPHLTADQLAERLGVVKTTMANKAGLINRTLDIGIFEPDLTRIAIVEQHPVAWLVEVDGFIIDVRTLPADLQDEARRRGLIPDLDALRAAA
jgi:Domain of unknown function (DUF6398)